MTTTKTLYLLDAYALIFRSYYAFIKNPRINSKGLNTSAIFGFLNTLQDVLNHQRPSHIAVVFDYPGPNFRHAMYSNYKANRLPTPEDLKKSIPYIKQLLEAYHIPIFEIENVEADDVIGTLAKKAEKAGFTVYMMTSDKDYCQLVSDNIFMFKPSRSGNESEIWGVAEVQKAFQVENPLQVIDVLALWGDQSDNIPGADGVGEKTSKNLIAKYKSVENLYSHIRDLTGKQRQNIEDSKEKVLLAKKLVTIKLDVPVELDETALALKNTNKEVLRLLLEELEFRTLIRRLIYEQPDFQNNTPNQEAEGGQFSLFAQPQTLLAKQETVKNITSFLTIANSKHNYILVDSEQAQDDLITKLLTCSEFCFDTETTSLNTIDAQLVGIAFCMKAYEAFYVPFAQDNTQAQQLANKFKPVFANTHNLKIGQNLKYDIAVLQNYDVEVKGQLFDTMLAHYLLHPEQRHNMDALSEQYLGYQPVAIEHLIGKKGHTQLNMRQIAIHKIVDYACEDADITFRLKQIFEPELKQHELESLFYDIEIPLIYALANMERTGVKINPLQLNEYAHEIALQIEQLETAIKQLAGVNFNLSSPKQLGEVLFDRMKIISNPNKTKTKQYATGESDLIKIANKHTIVPKILEHRSLKKLLSTYIESLPPLIHNKTGRIHTSYNQAVTTTGRLSSNNPNLQNIPIRTAEGRKIRKAFVATDENHVLLSADYSQIELRIMAHLSQDDNMIAAFNGKKDIHAATAANIFGVDIEQVSREQRSKAKSANFGIIYGISSFGLSENLNISKSEAKQLIDGYFNTYPKVKEYMDKSIALAREHKYVKTMFDRRRYLPDIDSRNHIVKGIAERNAINAPIQGTAADIIKIAMNRIFKRLNHEKLHSKMILQVHDELVFDVYKPELEVITQIVIYEMEHAAELNVYLTVEHGVGNNWLEAH